MFVEHTGLRISAAVTEGSTVGWPQLRLSEPLPPLSAPLFTFFSYCREAELRFTWGKTAAETERRKTTDFFEIFISAAGLSFSHGQFPVLFSEDFKLYPNKLWSGFKETWTRTTCRNQQERCKNSVSLLFIVTFTVCNTHIMTVGRGSCDLSPLFFTQRWGIIQPLLSNWQLECFSRDISSVFPSCHSGI